MPPRVGVCGRNYTFAAGAMSGTAPAMNACSPDEHPPALAAAMSTYQTRFEDEMTKAASASSYASPDPSIQGLKEARLVADWSRKRLRGERVSREPPSLANPDAVAAVPARAAEPAIRPAEQATDNQTAVAAVSQTAPAQPATPVVATVPTPERFGTDGATAEAPAAAPAETTADATTPQAAPVVPADNPARAEVSNAPKEPLIPFPSGVRKLWPFKR